MFHEEESEILFSRLQNEVQQLRSDRDVLKTELPGCMVEDRAFVCKLGGAVAGHQARWCGSKQPGKTSPGRQSCLGKSDAL